MFLRWRIWIVYALLFALAIPWYWRFVPLDRDTLLLGMPVWATAAVIGSLAVSIYTAWLLRRPWPEETSGTAEGETP